MRRLIVGGTGFVGLNLAEAMLARGDEVVLFDRAPLPEAARAAFAALPGRVECVTGDVGDRSAIAAAVRPGLDTMILGAAITAGAAREAREAERILAVNLLAQVPLIEAARDAGTRRIVNLSSAGAYGAAGTRHDELTERTEVDPVGLYSITKWASERVGARLADLWRLDLVSVRLAGVFGPWERATGVRDTLSPLLQVSEACRMGQPAILPREGLRDWIYARDVAGAVLALADAGRLGHGLYNITTGLPFTVLAWGRRLAMRHPGFVCRLAEPGEAPTIDLHAAMDRSPLSPTRLFAELGWSPAFGLDESVDDLDDWRARHGV